MNRKGIFLLKAVMGTVIAAIGIGFIIFLGVKLYSSTIKDTESSNAQTILDSIEGKINILKAGESGTFPIQSPCGQGKVEEGVFFTAEKYACPWLLTGWSWDAVDKPDVCGPLESCVCACRNTDIEDVGAWLKTGLTKEGVLSTCQTDSYCRTWGRDELPVVDFSGNEFAEGLDVILFERPLIAVDITKGEGSAKVTSVKRIK
jgi:hypothetical protein